MTERAHYPSGEPGTTGREPFEEGRTSEPGLYDGLSGQEGAGGAGGLATDAHGGTIARDTGVRDGEVVGLGGPKDSGLSSSDRDTVGSGPGAGLGAGAAGAGLGAGSAQNQNFGAEHSSAVHGDSYGSRGTGFDKTGNLDQEAHMYESTGAGGPTTGGAANTDKFDTDRSGATGNSYGATDSYPDLQHTESRKGTGGIGGILGTKDSEFTANPSRTGKGAYTDDDARYKTNTDGPSGHSALTGREGTTEHNPVAQTKGNEHGTGANEHEKKGLVEKVKEVFHK